MGAKRSKKPNNNKMSNLVIVNSCEEGFCILELDCWNPDGFRFILDIYR